MATLLVETSLFTDILSPSVEDQINSLVSCDTENDEDFDVTHETSDGQLRAAQVPQKTL